MKIWNTLNELNKRKLTKDHTRKQCKVFLGIWFINQNIFAKCWIISELKCLIIFPKVLMLMGNFFQKKKTCQMSMYIGRGKHWGQNYFIMDRFFCSKTKFWGFHRNILLFIFKKISKSLKLCANLNCFWQIHSRVPLLQISTYQIGVPWPVSGVKKRIFLKKGIFHNLSGSGKKFERKKVWIAKKIEYFSSWTFFL